MIFGAMYILLFSNNVPIYIKLMTFLIGVGLFSGRFLVLGFYKRVLLNAL